MSFFRAMRYLITPSSAARYTGDGRTSDILHLLRALMHHKVTVVTANIKSAMYRRGRKSNS